ncbi:MAG TPA: hypothetical protein DEB39_04195 [Planctomycetaceae bacterium]|nr:hypothetical protein [Planctomycetaceae bacterium]
MPVYIGTKKIAALRVGETNIKSAYYGDKLVYQKHHPENCLPDHFEITWRWHDVHASHINIVLHITGGFGAVEFVSILYDADDKECRTILQGYLNLRGRTDVKAHTAVSFLPDREARYARVELKVIATGETMLSSRIEIPCIP